MNRKAWKIFGLACTVFVICVWAANLRDEFRHLQNAASGTGRHLIFSRPSGRGNAKVANVTLPVAPEIKPDVPLARAEALVAIEPQAVPQSVGPVSAPDSGDEEIAEDGGPQLPDEVPSPQIAAEAPMQPVAEDHEAEITAEEKEPEPNDEVQAVPVEPPVKRGVELRGPQAALSAPRLAEIEKIKKFMEEQHQLQASAKAEAPMKKVLLEQFNSFRRDVERRDLEAAENTKQEQLKVMKAYAERLERERLAKEAAKLQEQARREIAPEEVAKAQAVLHNMQPTAARAPEAEQQQEEKAAEPEEAVVHGHVAVAPVTEKHAEEIVVHGHVSAAPVEEPPPPPQAVVLVHGHVAEAAPEQVPQVAAPQAAVEEVQQEPEAEVQEAATVVEGEVDGAVGTDANDSLATQPA